MLHVPTVKLSSLLACLCALVGLCSTARAADDCVLYVALLDADTVVAVPQEIFAADTLSAVVKDEPDAAAADGPIVFQDTLMIVDGETVRFIQSVPIGKLGHSPHTATMYAAILPGLGQIYNKKYWKLPFLYGGAAALVYAIHFNNKYYKKYSSAYRDFLLRDPNNKSYMEFADRVHLTEADVTGQHEAWFKKTLSNKKDYYRRYRDLSIFGMVGLYLVQIVDACVDAHFFNFDVSDDLSVRWQPDVAPTSDGAYAGATLALSFGRKDSKSRR